MPEQGIVLFLFTVDVDGRWKNL